MNGTTVWVAGTSGVLLVTPDAGITWRACDVGTTGNIAKISTTKISTTPESLNFFSKVSRYIRSFSF
jgi:photosystem II stability/assembly factor-like uncharacterized protein